MTKKTKTLKVCGYCNIPKSLSEFGSHKKNKDGKQAHCKNCRHQQYQAFKNINLKKANPWNNITNFFSSKKYDKIISHPLIQAFKVFDTQTLEAQFVISTQRFATAKSKQAYNRYLSTTITNLLALAQKTSVKNARTVLSHITTDKNAYNTATQHTQVVKMLPRLKSCLDTFSKTTTITTKKTAPKATKTNSRVQAKKHKHSKVKKERLANNTSIQTTKTNTHSFVCGSIQTLWTTGNIILIKRKNKIIPIKIKKMSENKKCFLSDKDKWYEIKQIEYIDFVTAK